MKVGRSSGTFHAFKNRNYALFFSGQSLSQIGTWMQRTAVSWVVYDITHSTFMLGLSVFAAQFPTFLLSLYGGIISDRYNRHKILLFTQVASLIQAVLLTAITLSGHLSIEGILLLSLVLGIINAFDVPARQPLVHELVNDKADLPNALALNSAMVNLARLIGPAFSGIILQQFGAGICFLVNAVSFMAVISSLLLMKLPAYTPPVTKKKISTELAEGFQYLKGTRVIGGIILLLTLASLLVLPYDTLLPVFAKVVFHGDAATYGYIRSFIGLGAIGGTLFLASLKKGTDLKLILLANLVLLGAGLMLFSHIDYFPIAMVFAIICGFGTTVQTTSCITIIQVNAEAHMRGRMMGYVALSFFGMLPLGSLIIGSTSQQVGAPDTLLGMGIMAVIIAILFSNFLRGDKLNKKEMEQLEETEDLIIDEI